MSEITGVSKHDPSGDKHKTSMNDHWTYPGCKEAARSRALEDDFPGCARVNRTVGSRECPVVGLNGD